jgi:hypothetical protein
MGFNPIEVKHLKMLNEKNYGPLEFNQIKLNDTNIFQSHIHQCKRPESNIQNISSKVHIYVGEVCKCGCPAFIRGSLDPYGIFLGWDNLAEISIIVGKNPQITEEQLNKLSKKTTIIMGDCAKDYRKYGRFLPGCAPNYMNIHLLYYLSNFGTSPTVKDVSFIVFLKSTVIHLVSSIFGKKYKSIK